MKFTTLIPTKWNDGKAVNQDLLDRLIESIFWPFRGMTNEGIVDGLWVDDDGMRFTDRSLKISIECERDRLQEAIKLVRQTGRRLKQRAMYFEVSGYDGVQFLRMRKES